VRLLSPLGPFRPRRAHNSSSSIAIKPPWIQPVIGLNLTSTVGATSLPLSNVSDSVLQTDKPGSASSPSVANADNDDASWNTQQVSRRIPTSVDHGTEAKQHQLEQPKLFPTSIPDNEATDSVDRSESASMEEIKSPLSTSRSRRTSWSPPDPEIDGGSVSCQIALLKLFPVQSPSAPPPPAIDIDQSTPSSYRSLSGTPTPSKLWAAGSDERSRRDSGNDDKGIVELEDMKPISCKSQWHADRSREPGDGQSSSSDEESELNTSADKTRNEKSVCR